MKNSWKEVTVEELKDSSAYSIAMGPFGSNIKTENFVSSGVPVIRGVNLKSNRFLDDEFAYLTDEKADQLKSANAFPNDLVFTHRGTLGQVGIIPQNAKYKRYVVSQSQMKLRCDPQKADPMFVFYFFKSPQGQQALLANTSTTGVPAISSPLTSLRAIRMRLPPLPEQRAIAGILGALDDKIELNRRMNQTFESMARAVFRQWFVDNEQSRTWQEQTLIQHVEAEKGLSYKGEGLSKDGGTPMHNLNSVYEGGGYKYEGIKYYTGEYKERHVLNAGDIIVTNTEQGFEYLLIGYPAIVPKHFGKTGIFTHHIFRVRPLPTSPLRTHYLYFLLMDPLVREQIIGCTNGTTVNMLSKDGLQTPKFKLPSKELIDKFERFASPIFDKMELLYEESRTLASLRDTLLPKLMRGEVRVRLEER